MQIPERERNSYAKNPSRPAQNVSADKFAWQTIKEETVKRSLIRL
jgi:hypothetical protein